MKQNITTYDLDTLPSGTPFKKLSDWCEEKEYTDLHLSIGQMIEFLHQWPDRFSFGSFSWKDTKSGYGWCVEEYWTKDNGGEPGKGGVKQCEDAEELCDALWETVKEVLK